MKIPHPFPYQGSKRLLAPKVLQFFPNDIDVLYEPFAGSAAISLAAAAGNFAKHYVVNDLNTALIRLWSAIVNTPEILSKRYEEIWQRQAEEGVDYYNHVRDHFNKSGKPDLFLFLLVRCVKAAVRYNANGEFNQSQDKRRKGTKPESVRREIMKTATLLQGKTEFHAEDYTKVISRATPLDLIYMDPPYQGVSAKRNSRYLEGLSYDSFVSTLDTLNQRAISYIVSYDGRTGNNFIGHRLPSSLKLQHVELAAGRSSQATLLGRTDETFESLYISPSLQERLNRGYGKLTRKNGIEQLEIAL